MKDTYGSLDVVVNGAAGNFLATASTISTNGFKTVLEIDTLGTFNMCQAAFKTFMGENGGVIINISASLHWNGSVLQAHPSAAKAGIDALTKVLACEWGPHGIRVCGIVPGFIEGTEGFARLGSLSNMNNKEATKAASGQEVNQKEVDLGAGIIPA
jgi:peroxisomal 2,4-dienoyl-CoA reductase